MRQICTDVGRLNVVSVVPPPDPLPLRLRRPHARGPFEAARDAPEELAPKRFAKSGGVPIGRRKVAGSSGFSTGGVAHDRMMLAHLAHWRKVRRHARQQISAKLLRHRGRLEVLLSLPREASDDVP